MLIQWLNQFRHNHQVNLLDIHLSLFLANKLQLKDDLLGKRFCFLVLSLSLEVRSGHVCLDIRRLNQQNIDPIIWLELAEPSIDDWLAVITFANQHQAISYDNVELAPLVYHSYKLYLQRMWLDERQIANYFNQNAILPFDCKPVLAALFSQGQSQSIIDWQKVAVAVALTRKFAIISGGPGTGKTTTVAKILAGILLTQPGARIVTAAPTGKAASRLTESLSLAIEQLNFQSLNIDREAVTLHRLLGARSDNLSFIYHKKNPLHIDVLVIDEASMVDLNMMARVIDALPNSARLILLGDKDQLSSVEAGAVFGDLCEFIESGYSASRASELSELTDYAIPSHQQTSITIADSLCLLQKSYRFDDSSGIGLLATAVKEGKHQQVKKLLVAGTYPDIAYHRCSTASEYEAVILDSVKQYQVYLSAITAETVPDAAHILALYAKYRLLCALREGMFGVTGLNKQIESVLQKNKLIELNNNEVWYVGRPVMILRNSASLGLYNGDIGIALRSDKKGGKLRVYFPFPDGTIKGFSPFRLPQHETAYVMTVHKSQGSEFDNVNIILPVDYSPLLNRSLLYTAITRAKKTVSIYATDSILTKAVKTQTERQSGLVDRLKAPNWD